MWGVAIVGGLFVYYNLYGRKKRTVVADTAGPQRRRIMDETYNLSVERTQGKILGNSGHPDQYRMGYTTRKIPKSMKEVQEELISQSEDSKRLAKSNHFNSVIQQKQQYSAPSEEIHYPHPQMGSNWYSGAAKKGPCYYTRVVPYPGTFNTQKISRES